MMTRLTAQMGMVITVATAVTVAIVDVSVVTDDVTIVIGDMSAVTGDVTGVTEEVIVLTPQMTPLTMNSPHHPDGDSMRDLRGLEAHLDLKCLPSMVTGQSGRGSSFNSGTPPVNMAGMTTGNLNALKSV